MLKEKLDRSDYALAMILDDPILCAEFLRNTKDGDKNKENWPKREFKYRWYQRDLLSDRSPFISVAGGRSIGKCQISTDNIYTDRGYKTIAELKDKKFYAWAYDHKKNELALKRAFIMPNGLRKVYTLRTESGYKLTVTGMHPILTPDGWRYANELSVGNEVAVITQLPHVQGKTIPEYEARLLAYFLFKPSKRATTKKIHDFKTLHSRADAKRCLNAIGVDARDLDNLQLRTGLPRKVKGIGKYHPLTTLLYFYGYYFPARYGWINKSKRFKLPQEIKEFDQVTLTHFLEALLAEYGTITAQEIAIDLPSSVIAKDVQELLLRYGIETFIEATPKSEYVKGVTSYYYSRARLVTRDKRAVYRILTQFNIPGYRTGRLEQPLSFDPSDNHRYEMIKSIDTSRMHTYAVQVLDLHTYITDNVIVHNSLVMEDKMLVEFLQHEQHLTETKEALLTTANQNQLTPILDRFIIRCMTSQLLKPFISGGLNRQKGTIDFMIGNRPIRYHARIAGAKSENSVVGLHLPRVKIDEAQLYHIATYRQLQPILNTWEPNTQMWVTGVPNGLTNSALYYANNRAPKFKKYRIPAPNNPYFTFNDFIQAMKDYGGDDTDLFKNLILGEDGSSSEQVLTRDSIATHALDFYNYRYTTQDKVTGIPYILKLERPILPYDRYIAGIDVGFVDPTIIQVFGLKDGKWHVCARYKLQRIEYPEQEEIIDYLDDHFHFEKIMIDIGAGGGGATILQYMLAKPEYKSKNYANRIEGVQFSEFQLIGYDIQHKEIKQDTKSLGASELVRFIQGHQIVLSEIDAEGISELERIAKQKNINGTESYFILSENGRGKARNDHIFASFICFVMGIRDMSYLKQKRKKLGRTIG